MHTLMCDQKWSTCDLKPVFTCDLKPTCDYHAWFGRHVIPHVVDKSDEMWMGDMSIGDDIK